MTLQIHKNSALTSSLGHLLIVDYEIKMLTALCETLAGQGYETTGFTMGKEALKALKEQNFDLLLTDLKMPEMDGITLLKEALKVDPNLVVIIMTGQGTIETAVEAMKAGALDYVLKPFKLNLILPALSRAMGVRWLRMENVQLRETLVIYELSLAAAFTLDQNFILNKVADAATQGFKADELSIMLPTKDGQELSVAIVRGENRDHILGYRVPANQGIAGWVARHKEAITLRGEVDDPRFAPAQPRSNICSSISVPMLAGGKAVGVFNVNAIHRSPFTPGEVKALNILVNIAGSALHAAQLYEQVKQAETKYRSIFENAVEGIFQTTPDGRWLAANPALVRMFGYDSSEDLMESVTDITHQIFFDSNRRSEFARLMKEQGFVSGYEYQAYRKDASVIWISENARAVKGCNGMVLYYEGTCEDITARKRSEEQILRQTRLLEGINKVFRESLICETAEEVARKCLAVAEELTGSKFGFIGEMNQAGHFDTIAISNPGWDTCKMSDSKATRLIKNMQIRGIDRSVLKEEKSRIVNDPPSHPDCVGVPKGHPPITSFLGVPLKQAGRTIGMIGLANKESGYDPADQEAIESLSLAFIEALHRKRAEVALSESKEKYRSLVESTEDNIYLIDKDLKYLFVNQKNKSRLGLPIDKIIGSKYGDFHSKEGTKNFAEKAHEIFETGQSLSYEYQSDSDSRYFIRTLSPLKAKDGRTTYVTVISKDITERKRAEDQLRKNKQMLQAVFDGISEPLIMLDGNLSILTMNRHAWEYYQTDKPEKFLKKPCYQAFKGRTTPCKGCNVPSALRKGRHMTFERKGFMDPDRSEQIFVYPLKGGNSKEGGAIIRITDITERKLSEQALKQSMERIKSAHAQRKMLAKKLIDLLEKDRRQVAMELHDHVGQILTTLKMDLETIEARVKRIKPPFDAPIEGAQKKVLEAISYIRNIAYELRPSMLDDLGLVPCVRTLVENIAETTKLKIHFYAKGVPKRLNEEKELGFYRIAQEAINNIIKHARATEVFISLIKKEKTLSLSVEDNGVGFKVDRVTKARKGKGLLGLLIMQERAAPLGGKLSIDSRRGEGTHILVEIPL